MAKDPRFNFYPDNWSGGTKRMTFEQKGAYIELLMLNFYCLSDGLPGFKDHEALLALSHAAAYAALWDFLKPKFKKDGEYYCSERMMKEFLKSKKHSENQSERANKRWKTKKEDPTASAVADACNGTGTGNGTELKNKKESCQNAVPRETDSHDFSQPDIPGDEIFFPVDTKMVRDHWQGWKKSRFENHNARYSMMGEQAALKQLAGLSESEIIETILRAIAGKWKNLYPEKSKSYGNSKTDQRSNAVNSRRESFAKRHSSNTGR
jgi:uncharacterized protein YdaU (DUF1376 family)